MPTWTLWALWMWFDCGCQMCFHKSHHSPFHPEVLMMRHAGILEMIFVPKKTASKGLPLLAGWWGTDPGFICGLRSCQTHPNTRIQEQRLAVICSDVLPHCLGICIMYTVHSLLGLFCSRRKRPEAIHPLQHGTQLGSRGQMYLLYATLDASSQHHHPVIQPGRCWSLAFIQPSSLTDSVAPCQFGPFLKERGLHVESNEFGNFGIGKFRGAKPPFETTHFYHLEIWYILLWILCLCGNFHHVLRPFEPRQDLHPQRTSMAELRGKWWPCLPMQYCSHLGKLWLFYRVAKNMSISQGDVCFVDNEVRYPKNSIDIIIYPYTSHFHSFPVPPFYMCFASLRSMLLTAYLESLLSPSFGAELTV